MTGVQTCALPISERVARQRVDARDDAWALVRGEVAGDVLHERIVVDLRGQDDPRGDALAEVAAEVDRKKRDASTMMVSLA